MQKRGAEERNKKMNKTSSRANALLRMAESAPAKTIVQTVNGLLAILRKRGIAIIDFEDKNRKIHGFKIFTNTAYLLATKPPKEEEHGEH